MKTIRLAAVTMIASIAALLASDPYQPAYDIHEKSRKALAAVYDSLIARIRREQPDRADRIIKALRESQRAWLAYRDAQADFVGSYHDIGSASGRAIGTETYAAELTKQRVHDLKEVPDPF